MTMQATLKRNPKNCGVEFKVWLPYDRPKPVEAKTRWDHLLEDKE